VWDQRDRPDERFECFREEALENGAAGAAFSSPRSFFRPRSKPIAATCGGWKSDQLIGYRIRELAGPRDGLLYHVWRLFQLRRAGNIVIAATPGGGESYELSDRVQSKVLARPGRLLRWNLKTVDDTGSLLTESGNYAYRTLARLRQAKSACFKYV